MCFVYIILSLISGFLIGYKCKNKSVTNENNRRIISNIDGIEPQTNVPIADVRSIENNRDINEENLTVAQLVV